MAINFIKSSIDKIKKKALELGNYFNPTSNEGNNLWSGQRIQNYANSNTAQFIQGAADTFTNRIVKPYTSLLGEAGYQGYRAIVDPKHLNQKLPTTKFLQPEQISLEKGIVAPKLVETGVASTSRAMLGAAGISNPLSALAMGALSGGIGYAWNKIGGATDQVAARQAGEAAGYSPVYGGINMITGGPTTSIANAMLGGSNNLLSKILIKGGTTGLVNVLENAVFTPLTELRKPTKEENWTGFLMGIFGTAVSESIGSVFDSIKGVLKKNHPTWSDTKIDNSAKTYVRDKLGRFAEQASGIRGKYADEIPFKKADLTQVSDRQYIQTDKLPDYYAELDKELKVPKDFDIKKISLLNSIQAVDPEDSLKNVTKAGGYDTKAPVLDGQQRIKSYISGAGKKVYETEQYNAKIKDWSIVGDVTTSQKLAQSTVDHNNLTKLTQKYLDNPTPEMKSNPNKSLYEFMSPQDKKLFDEITRKSNLSQQPSTKAGLYDIRKAVNNYLDLNYTLDNRERKIVDKWISEYTGKEEWSGARLVNNESIDLKFGNEYGIQNRLAKSEVYGILNQIPEGQYRVGDLSPKGSGSKPLRATSGIFDVKNPNVSQQPLNVTKEAVSKLGAEQTPELPTKVSEILPEGKARLRQQPLSQTPQMQRTSKLEDKALEDIISQGRKQIGGKMPDEKISVKKELDNAYTQWVDRYNPIVQASKKAQKTLTEQGAVLRPENNPEYLVRRLTGAGGIADYRFRTELQPVLKQIEELNIPKVDVDTYLANKRIAGFGEVGREVYGADPVKAKQIVNALEQKYGSDISNIAEQLYKYQDKGFQEMIDFIGPENAKLIKQQNPDYSPLYRVMDELDEYLGLPTRKTMQGSQPIQKIKGSTRQIVSPLESIIGNTFKQRAAIEKNRVAKSIVNLQKVADMGFEKVAKSGNDTITVWNNGQKQYWKVGTDIADVAKGANEEAMNLVLKIIQAPAALLRQGATGRNPDFMIPNVVRDQLDAGITSKYGYIPFIDYMSGFKSMLTNDSVYQKWESSGAKIALGDMAGQKTIKQLQESKVSRQGLFKKLGSFLDFMGKWSEQPTRVGLFKKAYKKTGNEMLSLLESRDATVDFARMGSKMKVANSIIPFLNVGVQGFDKLIRSVKNQPGKVLLNATLYGSVPAIATTLYNLTNYAEEYNEIPQYEKNDNFVLVIGRNENGTVDYRTFPKGNILPLITNPVESFINYAYKNDSVSFKEMALQTLSSTLPVVGEGGSLQEIGIKTIGSNLPQAIKPITENLLNKSFYKYDTKKEQTKEIVPYYLQSKPDYQQTYKFTPKLYQKLGAVFDASPLRVQNLLEGYLAGYIKIPAQIIEVMVKSSKGEEISPNEKTIMRRFIKQTYPSSGKKSVETKPETPGLMERVTGKVGAAEQMPVSDNPLLTKYTYLDENNKEKEVDLTPISKPDYTNNATIDKKLLTEYKSDIRKQQNGAFDLYKAGKLSVDEASKIIEDLQKTYDSLSTGSKSKGKFTVKKVSAPKTAALKVKSMRQLLNKNVRMKPKKYKFKRKI